MSRPVTEESNPLSVDIDIATPEGIVSILQKCDKEIFIGYGNYPSIFDPCVLARIEGVAKFVKQVLEEPETGLVVFSGCGTSGRLGFMVARTFNEFRASGGSPEVFKYLIAGGDKALFTSQEAPEDDPRVGVEALKQVSQGKSLVVFVGITCGLSAPYVAGQLDYCMDHPDTFVPVLLGFNPVSLARNIEIETWDKTFLQVARRLESYSETTGRGFIVNPVVGPEPITGSSRMKSGTATKVLLETICLKALSDSLPGDRQLWSVADYIKCYQCVYDAVYSKNERIADIMQLAGTSLSSGGHLYYIGSDSLAIVGIIDGTECPPTYGATLNDVRGFVDNGFETLRNNDGDLSHLGKDFRIDSEGFLNDTQLTEKDTVVIVSRDGNTSIPVTIGKSACNKVLLTFGEVKTSALFDVVLSISINTDAVDDLVGRKSREMTFQLLREMATKWSLNAISTGAHVLKGKVYQNVMVDVAVSNNKLFHRAIGIIQRLGRVSEPDARECLLRSIYDVEEVTEEIQSYSVGKHIYTATPKHMVVPVALIAAVSKSSISDAKLALSKQPIVRSAISDILKTVV